jgi:tetratricopeptide (TPR) repeat protein
MTQMTQTIHHSHTRLVAVFLGLFLVMAPAAMAQSTMVKGKVVDVEGKPMVGVAITVEFMGGVNRKLQTKTDKRGEFIQLLTESGQYRITATDEKVGSANTTLAVRLGRVSEANIVLAPSTAANNDAKAAELRKAFDDGVTMSRSGNHDGAIERFQAAVAMSPNCFDCLYNIGVAYASKKDEKQAEAAWLKALEVKADYAEALNALSTLYNNQKRFDEASTMSAKAAAASGGGGSADAVFNQGIILWNQGKIAEAKAKFEDALKANPNLSDAHYQLGMALLNEGKLADAVTSFETYVKLAPDGQYATQAKGMITQLKK